MEERTRSGRRLSRKRATQRASGKRTTDHAARPPLPGLLHRLRTSRNPLARLGTHALVAFVAATGSGFAQDTGKDLQDQMVPLDSGDDDDPSRVHLADPHKPSPSADRFEFRPSAVPHPPSPAAIRQELEETSDWALTRMAEAFGLEGKSPTRSGLISDVYTNVFEANVDVDDLLRSADSQKEMTAALLLWDVVEAADEQASAES
jgi:hypothetical protein